MEQGASISAGLKNELRYLSTRLIDLACKFEEGTLLDWEIERAAQVLRGYAHRLEVLNARYPYNRENPEPPGCPTPGACSCPPTQLEDITRKVNADQAMREYQRMARALAIWEKNFPVDNPIPSGVNREPSWYWETGTGDEAGLRGADDAAQAGRG